MAAPPPSRWPRSLDALLVAVFIAAITLPAIVMFASPYTPERRKMYRILRDELRKSPASKATTVVKSWFSTRFGFRIPLVHARAELRVHGLGVSTSEKVVLGDDGWLFYADEHNVESHRRLDPLTPDELADWNTTLDLWSSQAQSVGAKLVVMFAPDKSTIYAEHMPRWATVAPGPSRFDQIAELIRKRTDVDFVDVRPRLLARHTEPLPLYYKTDTHWNLLGSYLGARELMLTLARHFPRVVVPPEHPPAKRVVLRDRGGDLGRLLGLTSLDDEDVQLELPPPRATIHSSSSDLATRDMHIANSISSACPDAAIPRALILRDSFGTAMLPYLAEHFGTALFHWTYSIDPAALEALHPDVIVIEIVERVLMLAPSEFRPKK
jgi:hypothetical protein